VPCLRRDTRSRRENSRKKSIPAPKTIEFLSKIITVERLVNSNPGTINREFRRCKSGK
jgi:hypothetical protein